MLVCIVPTCYAQAIGNTGGTDMGAVAYDQDFYSWALDQAALLREGKFDQLDFEHLVEEIEDMGNRHYDQLESRLAVLFMHLLKWMYEPSHRGASWTNTIREQRRMIPFHLKKYPGLKGKLVTILEDSYELAREGARDETGLPLNVFPEKCPWTFEQALNPEFWPESAEQA